MKKIIYQRPDGQVVVVGCNYHYRLPDEPEDDFIRRVGLQCVPDGLPFTIVDASAIPTDRTFRNALKPDLTFDLDRAKGVSKIITRMKPEKHAAIDAATTLDALKELIKEQP